MNSLPCLFRNSYQMSSSSAWSAPLALRQALQTALGESGIEYEGIYELLL